MSKPTLTTHQKTKLQTWANRLPANHPIKAGLNKLVTG